MTAVANRNAITLGPRRDMLTSQAHSLHLPYNALPQIEYKLFFSFFSALFHYSDCLLMLQRNSLTIGALTAAESPFQKLAAR